MIPNNILATDDYERKTVMNRSTFDILGVDQVIECSKRETFARCKREGGINFRAITTVIMVTQNLATVATYLKADKGI